MGNIRRTLRNVALIVSVVAGLTLTPASPVQAGQTDIVGPPGSGSFGTSVTALPSGNIVVTDPYCDARSTLDVGAVYLYDGATGALISTLTGSTADDRVGSGGVTVLSNGNYVVGSPHWNNGGEVDAGAATWGNGTTGVSGVVSSANSLVGSTADDWVGEEDSVTPLNNGNYVVRSRWWDNGSTTDAGAATWGDGASGVSGVVSSTNSLVGSRAHDRIGYGVVPLSNGNYVVHSRHWDDGSTTDAGAVTWGDGTSGTSGVVSSTNSLVGSANSDRVGFGVVPLSNGNYVVRSPYWADGGVADAGAVTWGDGTVGISGPVSSTNSLVGSRANDRVGYGVIPLSNGNYVVRSPDWDNGGVADAGAVTWGNGTTGTSGVVSSTNSLVGSRIYDRVGDGGVTALSNGNYVVISRYWANGSTTDAGAVTWGDGTSGTSGVVSSTNSLVGSMADDRVGDGGVTALSNGNYVVSSSHWDNGGAADAGAATWGDGTSGTSGVVSSTNSLVGSTADDSVGDEDSVTPLSNGNYVVRSPYWDDGGVADAGAVTWGDGTMGVSGVVSSTNSLVGSTTDDRVGDGGLTPLSNGNYVVVSPYWADGGAVTWGDGAMGIGGVISSTNSLVGSTADDRVGYGGVTALSNGNYVVISPYWANGGAMDAGAVTWGNGATGTSGAITVGNSVRGTAAGGGSSMVWAYDDTNGQLVVGRPADNIVTLFIVSYWVYLPLVLRSY